MDKLSLELSTIKWPKTGINMFNVTLLTDRANKKFISKKNENFRCITLDYDAGDAIGPVGVILPKMFSHISWIQREFINNKVDNDVLKQMKALNVDGAITLHLPSEMILSKKLGKPMLNFASYLVDPHFVNTNRMVSQVSISQPTTHPVPSMLFKMGRRFTANRAISFVSENVFYSLINFVAFPKWWYLTPESA
jgi:hypothetical protein